MLYEVITRLARRLFVREKLNLIVVGPLTGEIRQRLTATVEAY